MIQVYKNKYKLRRKLCYQAGHVRKRSELMIWRFACYARAKLKALDKFGMISGILFWLPCYYYGSVFFREAGLGHPGAAWSGLEAVAMKMDP